MPDKVTITGRMGPGNTVTSLVLDDVEYLLFNLAAKILEVQYGEPEKTQQFDINSTTTITDSISGGVHTWVVSQ